METSTIVRSLSALAQDTRLMVFRVLLEYGKTGLPAGKLGQRLEIPHNTLSFHLSHLKQAGLVSCTRQGRQLIYVANTDAVEQLISFLRLNCCILEDGEKSDCGFELPDADKSAKICGDQT